MGYSRMPYSVSQSRCVTKACLLTYHTDLQATQPQLYESLTSKLSPEEQQVIQQAVHQADAIALATQQEAQAAAAAEQTNGQNGVALAGSGQT
jgi:hypothetical protein